MTVAAYEFIRRFLRHVLADGFHRIRHYGFLANGGCSDHLVRLSSTARCPCHGRRPEPPHNRTNDSFKAADFGTRDAPNL